MEGEEGEETGTVEKETEVYAWGYGLVKEVSGGDVVIPRNND